MGNAQAVECPKCKMTGGIHRVEEAGIRGGPYWSCVYCGIVIEDQRPPRVVEGDHERYEVTGPTFESGRNHSEKW